MKRWMTTLRFTVGSVLGIMGFGLISRSIFPFESQGILIGIAILVFGTFITLGTLSPLRKPPETSKTDKDKRD